jgi:aryl-alcohol dehydrogenase-like predicted oxidoreductase
MEAYDRRTREQRTWDVIDAVQEIADAHAVPMARVALAWLVDRPGVTSVILGARTTAQLDDNLGAVELRLTDDETARLDAVSAPATADYPYGGPGVEQRSRRIEGGR